MLTITTMFWCRNNLHIHTNVSMIPVNAWFHKLQCIYTTNAVYAEDF